MASTQAVCNSFKEAILGNVSKRSDGSEWYCIHDRNVSDWMDSTRSQILQLFSEICQEAGVTAPVFPRFRPGC
jgi:hypothetical protein